jgi:ABC-type multidrug transport system fused ATPase/permease subunit
MLHLDPKVKEAADAVDFAYKGGSIEFKGVSFGHDKKQLKRKNGDNGVEPDPNETSFLFENFDLKIEAGTTNAIVGRSGFGKTTLLHLLFRIFDPEVGSVEIDGQNVKTLKFDSFR